MKKLIALIVVVGIVAIACGSSAYRVRIAPDVGAYEFEVIEHDEHVKEWNRWKEAGHGQ